MAEKETKRKQVFGRDAGPGRPKGVPNKITTDLREFWRNILERQLPVIEEKLAKLAATDPDKYLSRIMDAHEYVIPKLARTELSGIDGGPVQIARDPYDICRDIIFQIASGPKKE